MTLILQSTAKQVELYTVSGVISVRILYILVRQEGLSNNGFQNTTETLRTKTGLNLVANILACQDTLKSICQPLVLKMFCPKRTLYYEKGKKIIGSTSISLSLLEQIPDHNILTIPPINTSANCNFIFFNSSLPISYS